MPEGAGNRHGEPFACPDEHRRRGGSKIRDHREAGSRHGENRRPRRGDGVKHNSSFHNEGGQNGAGATIAATATALPQYELTRESVRYYLDRVFPLHGVRLEAMQAIVENSQIERRFCIHPVEFIVEPRPLEELSKDY